MHLITNKKNIVKQVEELEGFLNESFAILSLDANGVIQSANSLFYEIFNKVSKYDSNDLIGKPFKDLLSPELQEKGVKNLELVIKDGINWKTLIRNKDKKGKTHWVKAFLKPSKGKDGKVKTVFVLITEVKYKKGKRKARTEAALYHIIDITNQSISTKKMLDKCLEVLLTIPWLKVKNKGGFMLKQKGQKTLKMIAHRGLAEKQLKACNTVDYGVCLCGTIAQNKTITHTKCDEYHHKNQLTEGTSYSSYNIPILWKDKTLGVLFLYLVEGYVKKKKNEKFLKKVSQIIAAALYRKNIQAKREEYLRTQQSQAVLYHVIEISNKYSEEEDMLTDCLNILLDIDWLKVKKKGYIFFFDSQKGEAKLAAKQGVSPQLINAALQAPKDTCLCQTAIKEQRLVHTSNCTDSRHYISDQENENKAHGHYNIPILWRGDVLGIIVLYLNYGHKEDEFEEDFLVRLSKVIGAAMFRKRTRRLKDKQARDIIELNFQLKDSKEAAEEQNAELNALLENVTLSHTLLQAKTKELDKKQNDVMASITYAKRIQNALLPKKNDFSKLFKDSFVFDKPRDIVGGDFHWFSEKENFIFIIVADCTGHGVPGAFMTVVANSIINDVMEERGFEIPTQILEGLDRGIKKALNQEKTKNNDGMDMSLVVIDKVNRQLYFSGAKSPMIYLSPQGKLIEIKGSRRSIGGSQIFKRAGVYTMSIINWEENMWIYLFSDGYRDQFGENDTKFGKKRFIDTLQSLHGLNGIEQHQQLDLTLSQWQGAEKQIDDILCLGFKL